MKENRLKATIIAIAVSVMALAVFESCKRTAAEDFQLISVNPAFKEYIEGFTTGPVSTKAGIVVRLNFDVADSSMINQVADPSLLKIAPNIKGEAHWIDARTYRFQPQYKMPQNQSFVASFQLSKLIKVPDSLKTLEFSFYTIAQDFEVVIEASRPYTNTDLTKERLVGHILTADVEDIDKIKQTLTAKQNRRQLPISWVQESHLKKHIFTIDSIVRGEEMSTVDIQYNGKSINVERSGSITHKVPSINDFEVVNIEIRQHPEEVIIVRFSDPLNETQDLEGKIHMGDFFNYSYIIDGTELHIFPASNIKQNEHLSIHRSIKNINGKKLNITYRELIEFDNIYPNVRLVTDGVILPSSNGMIIPFEAINLKAVDVKVIRIFQDNIPQFLQVNELSQTHQIARVGRTILRKTIPLEKVPNYNRWNRFYIDLSTLIEAEPGAIYSIEIDFRRQHSTLACDDDYDLQEDKIYAFFNEAGDDSDDQWEGHRYYYGYYADYIWSERNNPCANSYYYHKSIKTNILATDIGLLAKKGETDALHIFANNLVTAEPMRNVEIEVINYQLQSLGKGKTDSEGICIISVKSRPYLIIARKGEQQSYLKMGQSNMLPLSSFDVSGERVQQGIKGFVYTERGVWRPGDSLYVNFMLEDSQNNFPSEHPVIFELYNPLGNLVEQRAVSDNVNGIYAFHTATDVEAPTGLYRLIVRVGKNNFYHRLRIEAIKPNRLRIDVNPGTERISLSHIKEFTIESQWLHGAIAKNLKVESDITLTNIKTHFPKYLQFNFDDPGRSFSSERMPFFSGRLDENGKVSFMPQFNISNAPGFVRANIETRVYEPGGEHSIDFLSVDVSPYQSYVGIKPPAKHNKQSYLFTERTNVFNIVNIKENGSILQSSEVTVEVYKLQWRFWWNSYDDATSFMNSSDMRLVSTSKVQISNGKGQFSLNIENNEWGRYYIKVIDRQSGHTSGIIEYFDWYGFNRFAESNKTAAAMLTLSTDKDKYTVGDNIKMSFQAPEGSRAYINIENGTEILKTFLVSEKNGNIDFSVKSEAYMAPNIYLSVSLIQPHENTIDGLPIRLYGVIPVFVEDPSTVFKPVISAPNVMRPEQSANIRISEAGGKAMTYTLAIVDEGLLNLTRFQTPCPHSKFYAREALGVKYWDIYNDVIGAWGGQIQRILSIGGDGYEETIDPSGQRANRFKPMVKFIGPFELKRNATNSHTIDIPEYIGSVRVMVVARDKKKYGNAEKSVPVKSPLMLLGTAPRVIGPGETFRLPVSVFATEEMVRNVNISIKTNDLFNVKGDNSRLIRFDKTGEQLINFDIEVTENLGVGDISIVAVSGNNRAVWNIELDVRPSNPPITNIISATIAEGNTWERDFQSIGLKGTNTNVLEVSSFIPMNIDKWLNYLVNYPHGCAEQTISGAFAMLYIETLSQASESARKKADHKIKHAISRIQSMQHPSGGIAMWPGARYPDDWTTSYAGHFIAEAQKKGYVVSRQFINRWQSYQQRRARRWRRDRNVFNDDLAQAYRLYSLAVNGKPEVGAMNRLSEERFLFPQAKWLLSATYAVVGRDDIAAGMSQANTTNLQNYMEYANTYGSTFRDKAFILETYTRLGMDNNAFAILEEMATELSERRWLSTQATAQALRSIAFYLSKYPMGKQMNFDYSYNNKANSITSENVTHNIELGDVDRNKISIKNTGQGTLYARLIQTGIPKESDVPAFSRNLQMTVNYRSLDGRPINPDAIPQGTVFYAEVNMTHPGVLNNYKSIALTQIFPSGWEVMTDRYMFDTDANSGFTYQDIRDDRVITYFDLDRNKSLTVKVRLSASYVGEFYLPMVYCEAMYNNRVSALLPGRWVKVTDVIHEN